MFAEEFLQEREGLRRFLEKSPVGDLADVAGFDIDTERLGKPVLQLEERSGDRKGLLGRANDPGFSLADVFQVFGEPLKIGNEPVRALNELPNLI